MSRSRRNCFVLRFFLPVFICLYCAHPAFSGENPQYNISATVDVAKKRITASETITFTNKSAKPLSEVFFHIYPNRKYSPQEKDFMLRYAGYFKVNPFPDGFDAGRIEITSVVLGGEKASFSIEGEDETLLKVSLPRSLEAGGSVTLSLDFLVDIPHAHGRFGWHENILALSRWYPILSVLGQDGWQNHPFYPFHRPFFSDAAVYSVQLTVPSDQVVIHSGIVKEEVQKAPQKQLTIETLKPVREFSLAMSPAYKVKEDTFEGIKIKAFHLAGSEFYAQKTLDDVKSLMQYYSRRFGPYPYEEFSVAPVYLGYGGEQMSNMVFIDTRVFRLPKLLERYFDFLISHETGHQWFYNLVGTDEFTRMWLEEGVNSYFILQYLEGKYGYDADIVDLPKALQWFLPHISFRGTRDYRYKLLARTRFNYPVGGELSSFQEPSNVFSLTYGKGSAVVSMLRYLIGQEAFDRIFTRIFLEYQFQNLSTDDFIAVCEKESGKDLKWFFDEWLNTAKNCDYAVSAVHGNKITLENRGQIMMPVDIEVESRDGKKETLSWDGQGKTKELTASASAVKSVSLDPRGEILDLDTTNNRWPRDIDLKVVPLYLGLYDIPLFLKEDSYNFIVGPEAASGGLGLKASFQKPFDYSSYAATDYDFNDNLVKSRAGFRLDNLFSSQTSAGFELFNTDDLEDGEEDLTGGKLYLRKELWPASYGLTGVNDHVTLYLIRDQNLNKNASLNGAEDTRNTSYLKKNEAIAGTALHLDRSGPYPDPSKGYKIDALLENAGHFLGATQYFYRGALDTAFYQPLTAKIKAALRLKYGWGYPKDKNLYELGGIDGLRGYDLKTLRGSNMVLSSVECRFPLKENLNIHFLDNFVGIESVGGVVFSDIGRSWFNDFDAVDTKYDAGLGLRFTVSIGSFLEKALLRIDVAQAINESKQDPYVWSASTRRSKS